MADSDIPYIMPWDEPELAQGKMPERIMKMWEREREKQSRTVDDRESRPCPHCGFMLHYDGWCMVHHDGPQKNRGEQTCQWIAAQEETRSEPETQTKPTKQIDESCIVRVEENE